MVESQGALREGGGGGGVDTRLAASVDSLGQRERCPLVKGFYYFLLFLSFFLLLSDRVDKTSHDDCHSREPQEGGCPSLLLFGQQTKREKKRWSPLGI